MLVNMVTSKLSSITGELFIARGTAPSFVLDIFTGSARKYFAGDIYFSLCLRLAPPPKLIRRLP